MKTRIITQEEYDDVVSENQELFGMPRWEAVQEAVTQFELIGGDLGFVKTGQMDDGALSTDLCALSSRSNPIRPSTADASPNNQQQIHSCEELPMSPAQRIKADRVLRDEEEEGDARPTPVRQQEPEERVPLTARSDGSSQIEIALVDKKAEVRAKIVEMQRRILDAVNEMSGDVAGEVALLNQEVSPMTTARVHSVQLLFVVLLTSVPLSRARLLGRPVASNRGTNRTGHGGRCTPSRVSTYS